MIFGLALLAVVDLLMIIVNAAVIYTIREDRNEFVRLHRDIWKKLGEVDEAMNNLRALSAEYGSLAKSNYASLEEIFKERH